MAVESLLLDIPKFVLVLFRITGMFLFAPLFGSSKIPKVARALLAVTLAMAMVPGVPRPKVLPADAWQTAVAIGGEMVVGLAVGLILSLTFIAAQWAGDIIGQQIGFNLSETFDPQAAPNSSLIGDMYYMLVLVVFLTVGGHRQMIAGIGDSFRHLPLLSVGINKPALDLVTHTLGVATLLALRLAAPVLVTMLVVDLTLGFLGKTMPQMNMMAAGLSAKVLVGLIVLVLGLSLNTTPNVLRSAVDRSLDVGHWVWSGH